MKKIFLITTFFTLFLSHKSFSYIEIHNYCPIQFIVELHAADGIHYIPIMATSPAYYIYEEIPVNSETYVRIWPHSTMPFLSVGTLASGCPGFGSYFTSISPMTVPFGAIYATASIYSLDDIGILILAAL